MILVVVLGGTFGLEQPRNSHLEFYPMFIEFLDLLYRTQGQSAVPHIPIQYAFLLFDRICNLIISLILRFLESMWPQPEPLFVHPGISSRMVDGTLCRGDPKTALRV